jgi:hypothetical protein
VGPLPDAGVDVLHVLELAPRLLKVRYWVRLNCCERERQMTHAAINKRFYDAWKARQAGRMLRCCHCSRMGRMAAGETRAASTWEPANTKSPPTGADYGVIPPSWPLPGSVAGGHWLWSDRWGKKWVR